MPLALKLSMTLLVLGCFMVLVGVFTDIAKGYSTKWAYLVYSGAVTAAFGLLVGMLYMLVSMWKM